MATSALDLYKVYEFLKRLAMPYEKWPAYKEGIIDKQGNILIPKKDRNTIDQKNAFQIFDLMILKLKKLLGKVPGGKSKIANYAAALWLIKEGVDWEDKKEEDILNEDISEQFLEYVREVNNKKFQSFLKTVSNEEAPANAAGGGNIAGMGVNGPSDVKVSRNVKKKLRRRKDSAYI